MAGVYISYPFCSQKCSFCNFASGPLPRPLERDYLAALAREIEGHAWQWQPETLYLGGGTPSRMPSDALEQLLRAIPNRPWREATIEAAPGTITPELARAWAASGVNRVSLGVQSFADSELRQTGRRHDARTVESDVRLVRDAGITNHNIDLIAGLPAQTAASWNASLDWVARLEPTHVSVYMFELDDDSRLGREVLAGGARYGASAMPSEDLTVELYERAVDRLAALGIERYEISNFARPGFESLHNLKYWRLEPYIGFGADAHSFDGSLRWQNVEEVSAYVTRADPREPAAPARVDEERFFVGLRQTRGIVPRADEWRTYEAPIRRFVGEGLLERDGAVLRLTRAGVLLSNEVLSEFIAS